MSLSELEDFMPAFDTLEEKEEVVEVPVVTGDSTVDFAIYKISRYGQSENLHDRRYFVKIICETAQELGKSAPDFIIPVLQSLMTDEDGVQLELLPYIGPLFEPLESCYDFLVSDVVPFLKQHIHSQDQEMRKAASEAFSKVSVILSVEDRGIHVLTFLLGLAHEDEDEDLKIVSIDLLDSLAKNFGKELCESYVVTEFVSLSDDQRFKVRSCVASNLINISQTVSAGTFTSKLLPIYLKLSNDPIWRVRKSCVESIVGIAQSCPRDTRKEQCVSLLSKFIADSSRWVKTAACQQLGPFIAAMAGENIHGDLITCYIDIAGSTNTSNAMDSDTIYHCAYNFPAVLLTLGPERWPDLKVIYKKLARDTQTRVRKTIASSIYEVARIIGCDRTEEDLLNVYEGILKDDMPIKTETIKNISRFVRVLTPKVRLKFLPVFKNLGSTKEPWRVREMIARQLEEIVYLYPNDIIGKNVFPIVQTLVDDRTFQVREKAARGMGAVFLKLIPDASPALEKKLCEILGDY